MPRAVAGVLPRAATSRPKVAAMRAHETDTARNPGTLPWIRTWNTRIAKAKDTQRIMSEMIVPLAPFPARNVRRERGALRKRCQRPRWRSRSMSMPRLAMAKSRNWMLIPPKEWA